MKIAELNKNCGLVAVQLLTGKSDKEIMDAFLKQGWEPNTGVYHEWVEEVFKILGFPFEKVDISTNKQPRDHLRFDRRWGETKVSNVYRDDVRRLTLAEFCRKYDEGDFYVSVNRHALVVQNGIATDPNNAKVSARRRVRMAYRVFGAVGKRPRKFLHPNEDPVVRFYGSMERQVKSAAAKRERDALYYINKKSSQTKTFEVRLSELLKNTAYNKVDAMHDIRRGRLRIVE